MSELVLGTECQAVHQLLTSGAEFLLLDCREPDEHAVAHIDGATLLPMSELEQRQAELPDKQTQIIVYCHLGMRSARVANWLRQQGYANAQSMAGGIDAWAVEINPTLQRY